MVRERAREKGEGRIIVNRQNQLVWGLARWGLHMI